MDINYLIIPIVGAFIGYITNSIAITMLFRPRTAKHIGKLHIPFTPGIVPKERVRLSKSVASVICEHLLNGDVLSEALLSEESIEKVESVIEAFFEKYSDSDLTTREALNDLTGNRQIEGLAVNMTDKLTDTVSTELANFSAGGEIAESALHGLKDNLSNERGYKSLLSKLMDDRLISSISSHLGSHINSMVRDNAPQVVGDFVGRERENIMNMPCRDLVSQYIGEIDNVEKTVIALYRSTVETYLPQLLSSMDLPTMIENRINDFDMSEAEGIIRSVVNRELKAVIWLGALLGFVIGLINLFFI